MKKLMYVTIAVLMLAGMLLAEPMMNPNAPVGPKTDSNPNLKPRLMEDGTGMDRMMDMNLTPAQKTKLEGLRASHQKTMNTIEAEIENLHIDIRAALKSENFVNAKKLTQQLFEKKISAANARIDHLEMVMKELTPEQKEKGREMFMEMMNPDGPRGQMGMHPGMMNKMHSMKGCKMQGMEKNKNCCNGNEMKMEDCGQGKEMHKDCETHKDNMKHDTNKTKAEMKN